MASHDTTPVLYEPGRVAFDRLFVSDDILAARQRPTRQPGAKDWSTPVSELSGRLHVQPEDLRPGLRHAVYLELRNHALIQVAVSNQPEIRAELYDSTGEPVSTWCCSISGPAPTHQWAVIPRDAYVGFRVDMQTLGVPTRDRGMALIAVGGKSWAVGAGTYVLEATVAFERREDTGPDQWVGELVLPPVEIVVPTQMFAPQP